MTNKPDWSTAADLPPDELARLLEVDADEIDDGASPTDAELSAMEPGKRRPGQRGPGKRPAKALLTLRVDQVTLSAWEASGEGWRARINDLLGREAPKAT